MEPRRRHFLTEPTETLILARSALGVIERFNVFKEWSGIDQEFIVTNPLVSIPLPTRSHTVGPRGWQVDALASAFWHPLFWLPERIAMRYRFRDTDGSEYFESEDQWVTRVALECTLSGLFDPTTGTWFDILAASGLDSDDPATMSRVSAWLAGEDDPILDTIDLSPITEVEGDPDWALGVAAELMNALPGASWAVLADDLTRVVFEATSDSFAEGSSATVAEVCSEIATYTRLATSLLEDVPASSPSSETPAAQWASIAAQVENFQGSIDELANGPWDALSESLYSIRDDYWMFVELLNDTTTAERAAA